MSSKLYQQKMCVSFEIIFNRGIMNFECTKSGYFVYIGPSKKIRTKLKVMPHVLRKNFQSALLQNKTYILSINLTIGAACEIPHYTRKPLITATNAQRRCSASRPIYIDGSYYISVKEINYNYRIHIIHI